MKYWKAVIMFIIAFLIQGSILNLASIRGVTPNLALCLVIVFAFLYVDKTYAVVLGAIFGLLYDICFSPAPGVTAIPLVIVAVAVMAVGSRLNPANVLGMGVISVCGIAGYYVLNWALIRLTGNSLGIYTALKDVPFIGLYSLAVIALLYAVMLFNIRKRKKKERYFWN